MHQVNRFIVGVEMPKSQPWDAANLGAASRIAVRETFRAAAAFDASVDLVCVLPEISAGIFGSDDDAKADAASDKADAQAVLADIAQQHSGSMEVTQTVTCGRPWLEILKVAGTSRRNVIVCGTRDHGAISRLLFGSTGIKLLRNAAGPVWLVKPRIDDDAELDVLAATDLSDVGMDVLHTGVALGQTLPVRLNVLHVVDDDLDRHIARTGVSEEKLAEYREQAKTEGDEKLHEQLALTDYRTVSKGVQTHIAEGAADACILSAIEELDIDLLIMATSGRGGIPGMLFGNTAERLLPELPCSILAIKPDDFECPVSLD